MICRRLHSAVSLLADNPAVWETDHQGMLTKFLTSAPLDLAVEVGEKTVRDEIVVGRKPHDSIGFGGGVNFQTAKKVKWAQEDLQLICQLIEAIESAPLIECFEVEEFLYYCSAMVAVGPQAFEDVLREALLRWIASLPSCHDALASSGSVVKGPVHQDRFMAALAFLAANIVLRRRSKPEEALSRWVIVNGFSCSSHTIPELMFLGFVLGADLPGIAGINITSTAQLLLLRVWQAPGVPEVENEDFASALRRLAELVDPLNQWSIYTAENLDSARVFFQSLKRVIPSLAKYPNPDVRAAAARVLRLWDEQGSMPPELKATLTQFQQDARARVRFETRAHDS